MSVYCTSFNYLGKNSITHHNLMVAHFEPDSGEMDAFLGMEPIYTESYDGTRRIDYGAKFNSVATIKITMIKRDHSDFTENDVREYLKWLTGARTNSYLELIVGEEVKYSFLGRVTGIYQQKMDARTVGLSIEFSSVSPWAYSAVQREQVTVSNTTRTTTLTLNNPSDDLYTYVYTKLTIKNATGQFLTLKNTKTGEETKLENLKSGETIVLDNNMMISSSNSTRVFGNDFNYVWPRLAPGENKFEVLGNCTLIFEYVYPIKIGDCAIDTVQVNDPICNENGDIIVDKLDWKRIENTPTTLAGYGITDNVASIDYVNQQINGITQTDVSWTQLTHIPDKVAEHGITDVYTKTEVLNLFYKQSDTYTRNEVDNLVNKSKQELTQSINTTKTELQQNIIDAVENLKIDGDYLDSSIKSILNA